MIYLIRHGQTEWNLAQRMQGRKDSPLTQLGEKQAKAIGIMLKSKIDHTNIIIFSSPLLRAQKTTKIICLETNLNFDSVILDENLMELSFGNWEGLTHEEIERYYPGELTKRNLDKWNYTIEEGESYLVLAARIKKLLQEYQRIEKDIIIVTHDLVSKIMRGIFLNLNPEEILLLDKHPQNRIFLLEKNQIFLIDCEI